MALNLYKVRVYGGLVLGPLISVIAFFIVLNFYGFLWSLAGLFVGVACSVVFGKLMIKNAFSDLLEGNGVLALDVNSTGVIQPFIVSVQSPYIRNKKLGVDDIFDRAAVMQLATVQHAREPLTQEANGIRIVLQKSAMVKLKELHKDVGILELNKDEYSVLKREKDKIVIQLTESALKTLKQKTQDNMTILELNEDEYNKGRFALFHYPCLIYNSQIKSIVTKDFLADQEKSAFAEHGILYLNRKVEELTNVVRDFGRYVVELTKPQGGGLLSKWWVWAIIIVFVGILVAMFAGPVITAIKGTMGTASGAVQQAAGNAGGSVLPR